MEKLFSDSFIKNLNLAIEFFIQIILIVWQVEAYQKLF